MHRNASLFLSLVAVAFILPGCTAFDVPASEPGISRREAQAVVESFYWRPHSPIPSFSDTQLDALLARSANPSLDGERAEGQASAVAVALAVVGDMRFARALSRQSHAVQSAVSRDISYLWTHYHLVYPQTQTLLRG